MIVVRFTNGDFQQFPTGNAWHVDPSGGTIDVYGSQDTPGASVPAGMTDSTVAIRIALLIAAQVNSIAFAADPTPAPAA